MKLLFLLAALLFSTVSQAASVGTDASIGTDVKTGRKVEDTQTMTQKKGSTDKRAHGKDWREEGSASQSNEESSSTNREITVGGLFFPILAEIEQTKLQSPQGGVDDNLAMMEKWDADVGLGDVSFDNYIDPSFFPAYCKIFSGKWYVWGHSPQMVERLSGDVTQTVFNGYLGSKTQTGGYLFCWGLDGVGNCVKEEPGIISNGNLFEVRESEGGRQIFGHANTPGGALSCLISAEVLIEKAAKQLAAEAKVKVSKFTGERIFAVPDLQKKARTLIYRAFFDSSVAERRNQLLSVLGKTKQCLIPTPNGLQGGKTNVICGPFNYDQNALVLQKDGVKFVADDTIAGIKLTFSESTRASNSEQKRQSKSNYGSSDHSSEDGRELTAGRTKSKSSEAGTSGSRSGKSDVSASPSK